MSEEEDYDELPAISVNSTVPESASFTMPTAEELASQRARELETERELLLLRSRHAADDTPAAALAHCDSSGSEGEAALAAAVRALRVHPPAAAARPPPARRLLDALARAAPESVARALRYHAAPLDAPDERLVAAHLARVAAAVGALLAAAAEPWADEDALCAGALLAVALAAREPRGRRPAARAMHRLLDDVAAPRQAAALARLLREAAPERRVRLALSDALRGGGGGAERLADALLHAALADLLGAAPQEEGDTLSEARLAELAGAAWRRAEGARAALLQLLGRALAAPAPPAPDRPARRRLLAALAPPPRHRGAAHLPDELEVLVGASKLRLLFRSDD